ncbi:MAG: hypothetical protein LH606_01125 [Cytophagaceae bacterium]|nr:hypothetical protein [Cytophagaceae bacterium]
MSQSEMTALKPTGRLRVAVDGSTQVAGRDSGMFSRNPDLSTGKLKV